MCEFDWIRACKGYADSLHCKAPLLSLANCPTDTVYHYRAAAHARNENSDVALQWASITENDASQSSLNSQAYFLAAARQVNRHDRGRNAPETSYPSARGDPDLDLLI